MAGRGRGRGRGGTTPMQVYSLLVIPPSDCGMSDSIAA
jgi:hypothetical protein